MRHGRMFVAEYRPVRRQRLADENFGFRIAFGARSR